MFAYAPLVLLIILPGVQAEKGSYKFDLGPGPVAQGYIQVLPTSLFSDQTGYGFEPNCALEGIDRDWPDPLERDFITSTRPFLFSVALAEGNYRVTVTLGDATAGSLTTVKAELRRLMLESIKTDRGRFTRQRFIVNIRTPIIPGKGQVRLKERERTTEWAAWDHRLTLEFNGDRPCVCGIEVEPADEVPTVFLLGDSTVCDQPLEPWNSWGQMLPRFFKPQVAIANHAQSGESIRSSIGAGRFDKVWSLFRPGDYLLVQFGHNDMKDKDPNALSRYRASLEWIVEQVRLRKGTCVLITSMERKGGIQQDTLAGYPETVRRVAREKGVALIDLHAASKVLYKALGPDLDKAFQDGTHHTNYGSYLLAKCVVKGMMDSGLELARYIVDEFIGFDPNRPDPYERFSIPASPGPTGQRPLGS